MPEGAPGGLDIRGDARFPMARIAGLIVTELDDELVIYDTRVDHLHRLNVVSAAVWRACDGRRTVPEISVAASKTIGATIDDDAMAIALDKLSEANLLVEPVSVRRTSRRWLFKKAAIVAPAVVSVTAPYASASASGCSGDQIEQSDCSTFKDRAVGRCCFRYTGEGGPGICSKVSDTEYDCILL